MMLKGYGAYPGYEGSYLASDSNIIVVTINYRLAAFGFLVYGDSVRGNFGIKVGLLYSVVFVVMFMSLYFESFFGIAGVGSALGFQMGAGQYCLLWRRSRSGDPLW